mgnify:CR=1 FL=1
MIEWMNESNKWMNEQMNEQIIEWINKSNKSMNE